jgi:hypothetical protein
MGRTGFGAKRPGTIEGKNINLASLVLPPSNNHDIRQIEADGHYCRCKNCSSAMGSFLAKFIEAFNMFKNIICGIEDRRVELDNYLQDIIDMAVKFKGKAFYEYHKAFAKKAAAIKQIKGLTIDWAVRDDKLYNTICLDKPMHTCSHCGSSLHIRSSKGRPVVRVTLIVTVVRNCFMPKGGLQ